MLTVKNSLLLLLVMISVMLPLVRSISIVKHIPHLDLDQDDSMSNVVVRKAYNLIPGLKKLRAKSPAVGKDFVAAVVTGKYKEFLVYLKSQERRLLGVEFMDIIICWKIS